MKEKKNVWKVIKKAAEVEADKKNTGWPPACDALLFQSKRPECKKNK